MTPHGDFQERGNPQRDEHREEPSRTTARPGPGTTSSRGNPRISAGACLRPEGRDTAVLVTQQYHVSPSYVKQKSAR